MTEVMPPASEEESERMDRAASVDAFVLSPSVQSAVSTFTDDQLVTAAAFANAIYRLHTDYPGVSGPTLQDTGQPRTARSWLNEVQSLYDPARIQELAKPGAQAELHGRILIIGLALLERGLRDQLERAGVLKRLIEELMLPLTEFLTPRGRVLLTRQDVPNHDDLPLTRIKDDTLGRGPFARYLAERIVNVWSDGKNARQGAVSEASAQGQHGAYSILIYGPWGAGKSSVLNFLNEELSQRKWLAVEFNAWRHQHIRPPWWSLMEQVFRTTRGKLSLRQRLLEYWWRFNTGRVHVLAGLAVTAWIVLGLTLLFWPAQSSNWKDVNFWAGLAKALSAILALVFTIWGVVLLVTRSFLLGSAKAAQTYVERTHDPMSEIKDRFTTLISRLKSRGYRVLILVDDLDRCQHDYVVELLEGMQTLFREAPVVFVVAADRRWLNACFDESYGTLQEWVHEPGKPLGILFLEKAFQMTTPVPKMPPEWRDAYWRGLLSPDNKSTSDTTSVAIVDGPATSFEQQREQVLSSRARPLAEQMVQRERFVLNLARPLYLQDIEDHVLRPFSSLLEPNPRGMKRLVNAFSVNTALAALSFLDDLTPEQLALWTVLSLRWPRLAEYLAQDPASVALAGPAQAANGKEELKDRLKAADHLDLERLFNDEEVIKVFSGGPTSSPLTPEVLKRCALLTG